MTTGQKYVGKADNAKSNQSNGKKATQTAAPVTQTATPADLTPPPAEPAPQLAPNEATPEQWSNYGRDVLREPFVSNSFKLDVYSQSRDGNPQSLVLLFGLNNHQDYLTKEMLSAISAKHYQDAYTWWGELQMCNDLIFSIAKELVTLAENNYWAGLRLGNRAEYDQGAHREVRTNEKLYAKFLEDKLGMTIEEADNEEAEVNEAFRQSLRAQSEPSDDFLDKVSKGAATATISQLTDWTIECRSQHPAISDVATQIIFKEMTKRAEAAGYINPQ